MKSNRFLCWLSVAGLVLGGCGKGGDATANQGASERNGGEKKGQETANKQDSASDEQSGGYIDAMTDAMDQAKSVSGLKSLKQAIQMFQATEGRLPDNLQEVVSEGYIRGLPKMPKGKTLSYDPATGQVSIQSK